MGINSPAREVCNPMINPTRLAEIEARAEKATPGPWYTVAKPWLPSNMDTWVIAGSYDPHLGVCVAQPPEIMEDDLEDLAEKVHSQSDVNMDFIAASRTDIPELCAEVRRLQKVVDALKEELAPYRPAYRKYKENASE